MASFMQLHQEILSNKLAYYETITKKKLSKAKNHSDTYLDKALGQIFILIDEDESLDDGLRAELTLNIIRRLFKRFNFLETILREDVSLQSAGRVTAHTLTYTEYPESLKALAKQGLLSLPVIQGLYNQYSYIAGTPNQKGSSETVMNVMEVQSHKMNASVLKVCLDIQKKSSPFAKTSR